MTTRRKDEGEVDEAEAREGRVHEWVERGKEAIEDQKERVEDVLVEARRYIRKHPGRSVLIAAGVGFLLGSILGRRS